MSGDRILVCRGLPTPLQILQSEEIWRHTTIWNWCWWRFGISADVNLAWSEDIWNLQTSSDSYGKVSTGFQENYMGCPVSQSESVSGSFMGFYGFSGWETHGNWNLQLLMWSVVINNKEDPSGLEKYNLNEASVLRDSISNYAIWFPAVSQPRKPEKNLKKPKKKPETWQLGNPCPLFRKPACRVLPS